LDVHLDERTPDTSSQVQAFTSVVDRLRRTEMNGVDECGAREARHPQRDIAFLSAMAMARWRACIALS